MLLLIGVLTAAGRQGRSAVLSAKIGKRTCTLLGAEKPVCIQIVCAYTGIGDVETQSQGMLRKPGDLPQVCPRPKTFKRLATRDTLHGSRPNLRQRDPKGRIVPTPSDVSDEGTSTKRCAGRRIKNGNYTYTYNTCYGFIRHGISVTLYVLVGVATAW